MAEARGLLTELEREQIRGEHGQEKRYMAVTRARSRIEDELSEDIDILEEHHPQLLRELRTTVCPDDTTELDSD